MIKKTLKNILSFLLRFGISGLLLWYLSTKIDFDKTYEVLKSADWIYMVYALIIFLSIHIFFVMAVEHIY